MTYVKEKASFSGLLLRTYYVCDVTPFVKFRIKAQDNTVQEKWKLDFGHRLWEKLKNFLKT